MVFDNPNFTRPNDMLTYVNDVTSGAGFTILLVAIFFVAVSSLMARGNNFPRALLGGSFFTFIIGGLFFFLKVIHMGTLIIILIVLLLSLILGYTKRGEY
jgi:hypothetical protein